LTAIVESSNTTADTSSASVTVAMPSGIVAGNLLIVFCAQDAVGTITQSGGSDWSKLEQNPNSTICSQAIFAKIAAGSDTLTLTSTDSQDFSCVSVRITGHGVTSVLTDIIKGTAATGADAAPDPPNCNPGVSKDFLWLEMFAADDDDDTTPYESANYTAVAQIQSANSTSSCLCAVGRRALTASAENPGAMAMALTEEWITQTLAIPPAVAVSNTLTGLYDIRNIAVNTLTGLYDIRNIVANTLTGIYDIRNIVANTLTGLYDIRNIVSNTLSGIYDITNTVSNTLTGIYDILSSNTPVANTLTALYDIRNEVSNTLTGIYDIMNQVSNTLTGLYDIRNIVSNTLTGLYDIRNIVSNTLTGLYDIRAIVSNTLSGLYDISNRVSNTLRGKYKILGDIVAIERLSRRLRDLFRFVPQYNNS